MILFFDTETTGLPKNLKAIITDFENWPRLVQLAYQLFDDNGNLEIEDDYLVKPYGFKIPLEATNIHGITHEKAFSQGINISNVLNDFKILLDEADIIVAHNLDYDEKIIGCEFLRLKLSNPFINKHKICTMKSSTNFCAINGPNGYKWPSLSELHYKLFNTYFEEAHNAMIDIQATSKCFWELLNRGIIKENKTLVNLGTKIKAEDENDLIISNPIKELLEERQTLKNRLENDGNRSNYLNTSWVFEDKEGQGENIMEMETLNYKSIEIESEIDRIEKLLKEKGYIIGDNSQIIKIKLPEIKLGGNFSPENLMEKQHFNVPSLIPYRKKDKWGFCNPDMNIIIDCKYDYAEPFINDYTQIEINNKKFRIDLDNNISEITNSYYEGLCMNRQNEKEYESRIRRGFNYGFKELHLDMKKFNLINCWHINENESDAMWRLYLKTNEGVAVQTTVGKLCLALENSNFTFRVSKVRYIDYEKDIWYDEKEYPERSYNAIIPLVHKRKEFIHENEFRILFDIDFEHRTPDYWNNEESSIGKNIEIKDLTTIIDKLILPPNSDEIVEKKVEKIINKFHCTTIICKSKLMDEQYY